ncbi:MAG: PAS domain-containing protein, partial [Bacteroidales bacterium]|nr:PAS domain-containing protein [Bacteroidales bacterium]
ALKFREEQSLFPTILASISQDQLAQMNYEGALIGDPFVQAKSTSKPIEKVTLDNNMLDLKTGSLSIEQIVLIFNHLPVDITYVDEHDKVCYFSNPKKRIFPRTNAIIGRDVSNCHPPESVHIVEQIVQSFKRGEKDDAEFWIKMRGQFILIQYFAVRDEKNTYRGVIEVTQEVSGIRALEGEKRLLDW